MSLNYMQTVQYQLEQSNQIMDTIQLLMEQNRLYEAIIVMSQVNQLLNTVEHNVAL
jgi:ethanolamine utilization protein EutP (predicted NTPase)